jgi:hypothetical protein
LANLDDRVNKLRGRLRPRDPQAEARRRQAVADCDRIAAIIRDSGGKFNDLLARVEEAHPEWTPFKCQLEVKRQLILASRPDGERLWRVLAEAVEQGRGGLR